MDRDLERSQQMFADLNRHAVRPSKSLGLLFDHRDEMAQIVRVAVLESEFFRDIVELERSSLSRGSRKLLTLSSLYNGTLALLDGLEIKTANKAANQVREYWEAVAKHIPEWRMVQERSMAAGGVREDFIHSHGTVIHSLGCVGNALFKRDAKAWKRPLSRIRTIDWSRSNRRLWEGRAMTAGQVQKARNNVILTANAIKQHIGLPLSPEERRIEDAYKGMQYVG